MRAPDQGIARIIIFNEGAEEAERQGKILGQAGFAVRTARDMETALQRAEETMADLIIAEARPDCDVAFELCQRSRNAGGEEYTCPPALVILPPGRSDMLERAFESGAAEVLIKPFGESELLRRAGMILRLATLESELRSLSPDGEGCEPYLPGGR